MTVNLILEAISRFEKNYNIDLNEPLTIYHLVMILESMRDIERDIENSIQESEPEFLKET